MKLKVQRFSENKDSTLGSLYIDGKWSAFTLEDEYREVKVKHETRIPAGRYRVVLNKQITPMTEKYRKRFNWFNYHLMLENVPNFTSVYIHIGNNDDDTSGCILVGDACQGHYMGKGAIHSSTTAFKRIYSTISSVLENKEDVFIDVINQD